LQFEPINLLAVVIVWHIELKKQIARPYLVSTKQNLYSLCLKIVDILAMKFTDTAKVSTILEWREYVLESENGCLTCNSS
jgi:hypothetical protein